MRHIVILALVLLTCAFSAPGWAAAAQPANQFATDLYAHLPADGNLICSPLSVFAAMSMTSVGARGKTAQEMSIFDQAGSGVAKLIAGLETPDPDFQLHIANALWAQTGFRILPAFQNALSANYRCTCLNVDFADSTAASRSINDWVSQQTNGKIPDLFSPASLPRNAALVLTNAIYFHADWQNPFPAGRSSLGNFYLPGRPDPARRMMMHEHGSFPIMHADQFDVLELPYKGDKLGMLVVLPRSNDGLKALESKLSPDFLNSIVAALQSQFAEVSIPKFSFSWQISLRTALESTGISTAFNPNEADFSGMGSGRLYLSDVVQKAYISVDEAGTEAAAATGAVLAPTAMPASRVFFSADHPFLFIIRDHSSGAVLFAGRVSDPAPK